MIEISSDVQIFITIKSTGLFIFIFIISPTSNLSFAGQFSIKAAEGDGESLEGREWELKVQGEGIFPSPPKLKGNVVR